MMAGEEARQQRAEARAEVLESRAEAKVYARADNIERWKSMVATVGRWAFGGLLGSSVVSGVVYLIDRDSPASRITLSGGAMVGVYAAFMSERTKGQRAQAVAEAERRRLMLAAEAEPNHQARLAAERVAAEALRHLEDCHRENEKMTVRVDALELNVQLAHRENQKLTADVVDLAKRLAALDGRKA